MMTLILPAVITGPLTKQVSNGQVRESELSYQETDLEFMISYDLSSHRTMCLLLINIAFVLIEPSPATQLSTSVMVKVYYEF